eukprot:gene3004-3462_t
MEAWGMAVAKCPWKTTNSLQTKFYDIYLSTQTDDGDAMSVKTSQTQPIKQIWNPPNHNDDKRRKAFLDENDSGQAGNGRFQGIPDSTFGKNKGHIEERFRL